MGTTDVDNGTAIIVNANLPLLDHFSLFNGTAGIGYELEIREEEILDIEPLLGFPNRFHNLFERL